MKAIKLRVKYGSIEHANPIYLYRIVRFAFNRFINEMTQSEVYRKVTLKEWFYPSLPSVKRLKEVLGN